jgi:hypothetical protein
MVGQYETIYVRISWETYIARFFASKGGSSRVSLRTSSREELYDPSVRNTIPESEHFNLHCHARSVCAKLLVSSSRYSVELEWRAHGFVENGRIERKEKWRVEWWNIELSEEMVEKGLVKDRGSSVVRCSGLIDLSAVLVRVEIVAGLDGECYIASGKEAVVTLVAHGEETVKRRYSAYYHGLCIY